MCEMGNLGEGMKASRDSPVLMIPSLVHLWQPGPDVCQVGRTRASVREKQQQQFGKEKVIELSLALQSIQLSVNTQLSKLSTQ